MKDLTRIYKTVGTVPPLGSAALKFPYSSAQCAVVEAGQR